MKIKNKLFILILLVTLLPTFSIGFLLYNDTKDSIEETMIERLDRIAHSRAKNLDHLIQLRIEQCKEISGSYLLKQLKSIEQNDSSAISFIQKDIDLIFKEIKHDFNVKESKINKSSALSEIYVFDRFGVIVAHTNKKLIGTKIPNSYLTNVEQNYTFFSGYLFDEIKNEGFLVFCQSVRNIDDDGFAGGMGLKVKADILNEITSQRKGLGKTGELILAQANGDQIVIINELRHGKRKNEVKFGSHLSTNIQSALIGENGKGYSVDYRNVETISVWKHIPYLNWGMVVEMDKKEAFEPLDSLLNFLIVFGSLFTVFIFFIANLISNSISNPIKKATEATERIALGDLNIDINIGGTLELHELNAALNKIKSNLAVTTSLVVAASEGDFNQLVEVKSDKDKMAKAINIMMFNTKNLIWIDQGIIQIVQAVKDLNNINKIGDNLLGFLVPYLNAQVGMFYAYNKDEELLVSEAGYAIENNTIKLKLGEGLAGQSAKDKKVVLIENLSEDHLSLESSFYEIKPKNILVIPFTAENKIIGIVEIGSINRFSKTHLTFAEKIIDLIGNTLQIAENKFELNRLLEDYQTQNEELQASEEELVSQQNELERFRLELEQQIGCLNEATIVAITNTNGKIISVNDMFEEVSKYTREELLGNNHRLLKSGKQTSEFYEEMWKTLLQEKIWNGEICNRAKDGSLYWLNTTIVPFKSNSGKVEKYVGVSFDITEQHEQKIELSKKANELALISQYKSEFLANVSHELRTPLNSILLLSKMMSENTEQNLTKEQVEFASIIYSSGNGLLELINEILDLSKIESGKMTFQIEEVVLSSFIKNIERVFSKLASNKGIELKCNLEKMTIKSIKTDGKRLEQVLKNLLSNAIKFTEKGSVELSVFMPSKEISYKNPRLIHGKVIAFKVKDTGIGIPEDKYQLIFEPFQQAEGNTHRKYGGTGLGLTISKKITDLLGGELELESEVGKGSIFTLYIPIENLIDYHDYIEINDYSTIEAENENSKIENKVESFVDKIKHKATKPSKKYELLSKKKVLLIDDDYRNVFSLSKILEFQDMIVLSANNGKEAMLELNNHPDVDIILMDMMMPVLDGYKSIELIREIDLWKETPIIAVTAKVMMGDREKCIKAGATDYISKPVDSENLINKIYKYLK